jgi:hypothetical protein
VTLAGLDLATLAPQHFPDGLSKEWNANFHVLILTMSIIIPRVSRFTIQNIDLLVLVLNTVITFISGAVGPRLGPRSPLRCGMFFLRCLARFHADFSH